jgi:hypothetical protein
VKKGLVNQRVYFFDLWVGHGVATDGHTIAMYHNFAAGIAVLLIIGIRITDIESQVIIANRVEMAGGDCVITLRAFTISFAGFGAEATGIAANQVLPE